MLCFTPVLLFTEESLKAAVGAWRWLLAVRPDLGLSLFLEISDAWSWTVNQRMGLFSNAPRAPSPVAVSGAAASTSRDSHWEDPAPHRIWISFLSEQLNVLKFGNREVLDVLVKMLHKALANPEDLRFPSFASSDCSVLPQSVSTRYRLLHLTLRVLHSELFPPRLNIIETVLRERLYRAALTWFFHTPW